MTQQEEHALNREMDHYFTDYEYKIDQQQLEKIYLYLAEKKTFTSLQYRFLCWVGAKLGKSVKLNSPHLSTPTSFGAVEFNQKFLYSPKRTALYASLSSYITQLRIRYQLPDSIAVVVCGSFTDPNHDNPGDIDAVILLPESHEKNPDLHEIYQKAMNKIPAGIDIHFLPEDYDLRHYKAYSNISHLASKPDDKQKQTEVANNSFNLRELVKINL